MKDLSEILRGLLKFCVIKLLTNLVRLEVITILGFIVSKIHLSSIGGKDEIEKVPYRELIGSLIYLADTTRFAATNAMCL